MSSSHQLEQGKQSHRDSAYFREHEFHFSLFPEISLITLFLPSHVNDCDDFNSYEYDTKAQSEVLRLLIFTRKRCHYFEHLNHFI